MIPKIVNILVLVSGNGTNLQALIDAEKRGAFNLHNDSGRIVNGRIAAVVSDRSDVYALERAKAAQIDAFVEKPDRSLPKPERRRELSDRILRICRDKEIDFIVYAGFLSILAWDIINEYAGKMPADFCIDIRPSTGVKQ